MRCAACAIRCTARPLVNRDPAIGTAAYAAGHEAARWRMAPD